VTILLVPPAPPGVGALAQITPLANWLNGIVQGLGPHRSIAAAGAVRVRSWT